MLNKHVQKFNFTGLANQFETALRAGPGMTTWQLAPHLTEFYLGGSDTKAIGGDMAYLYGTEGSLNRLSGVELRVQLGNVQFGVSAQTLTKTMSGPFADVDSIHGDTLTYSATLADGGALPDWLSFDAATQTFSGTPTLNSAGLLNVRVMATDRDGASVSDDFVLDVALNRIVGTGAVDNLVGTELRDVIEGLADNDTLNGGLGVDTMYGGAGGRQPTW